MFNDYSSQASWISCRSLRSMVHPSFKPKISQCAALTSCMRSLLASKSCVNRQLTVSKPANGQHTALLYTAASQPHCSTLPATACTRMPCPTQTVSRHVAVIVTSWFVWSQILQRGVASRCTQWCPGCVRQSRAQMPPTWLTAWAWTLPSLGSTSLRLQAMLVKKLSWLLHPCLMMTTATRSACL